MERMDALAQALRLEKGQHVLDMGCGHAEMLLRWHERLGVDGVGVEASPYTAKRAREWAIRRGKGAVQIVEARGEDFRTDERFHVAACLGASWIWGGFAGTISALGAFLLGMYAREDRSV